MKTSHLLTALALVLLSACLGGTRAARAPDGRASFDSSLVRHPADTPFVCFRLVMSNGEEVSSCEVTRDWCVQGLDDARRRGRPVLSGCEEQAEVWCYTVVASGGVVDDAKSLCWGSASDCARMQRWQSEAAGANDVSDCNPLDSSFSPTALRVDPRVRRGERPQGEPPAFLA